MLCGLGWARHFPPSLKATEDKFPAVAPQPLTPGRVNQCPSPERDNYSKKHGKTDKRPGRRRKLKGHVNRVVLIEDHSGTVPAAQSATGGGPSRLEKAGKSSICLSVDGKHLKVNCGFGLDDSKSSDAQMPRSVKTAPAVLTDRVLQNDGFRRCGRGNMI